MSLTLWDKKDDDMYESDSQSIKKNFPLISNFIPPTDYPLDPHNDLLPPGYAMPLSGMKMGPPEALNRRYFSLTVDDIDKFKKEKMRKWIKVYEKVLGMCFRRIRDHVLRDENICLFVVPEYIPGFPIFNIKHCCAFILRKLILAGFQSNYVPPSSIIVSWKPDNIHDNIINNKKLKPEIKKVKAEDDKDKDVHYVKINDKPIKNITHNQQPQQPQQPQQQFKKSTRYGSQQEEPFLFQ